MPFNTDLFPSGNMNGTPPMSFNDMFAAQNLGMGQQSNPMSAAPQPGYAPSQIQQSPDVQHLTDVLSQLVQNKQGAQGGSGLIQQILAKRFQPDLADASKSIFQSNQAGQYTSPEQVASQRAMLELQPYMVGTDMATKQAELDKVQMANNITSKTGLPMAQAQLQAEQMKNDIMQKTGMSSAQADIAVKNAQANFYNSSLQRAMAEKNADYNNAIREKQFEYANDPAKAQASMMAGYLKGMTPSASDTPAMTSPNMSMPISSNQNAVPDLPQVAQQNAATSAQSTSPAPAGGGFNPMGAMLAKQFGLEGQQIGPNGQVGPIPGTTKVEGGNVITMGADGKATTSTPVNPVAQGKFEQKLQDIAANVDKLHALNGTVEDNGGYKGTLNNKLVQMSASKDSMFGVGPGGQDLLQGTPEQTLRDNIQADVKQALPLYMQAFGITPGMERAQSAQQMLLDAIGGAVGKSRQHLLANLANLSQTAGTGELARKLSTGSSNVVQWTKDASGKPVPVGGL